MNALVTGITGFAGRFLAAHLLGQGDQVLGTARQPRWTPDPALAAWIPPAVAEIELVGWNLSEELPARASAAIERFAPQTIFHLAAISLPSECGAPEPNPLARAVNIEGTRRVLDLAARLPAPPKVLLVSSSQVYAPVDPAHPQVAEDAPLGPRRGYGKTKLAAEQLAGQFQAAGLRVVVARAFQHTGPGQQPPLMLPQWARQLAQGGAGPVEVFTRDAWIDLTDVRDVVRAYRLLAILETADLTYNVASGVARSSRQVLDCLLQAAGADREVRELFPGPKCDPIGDIGRLRRDTNWQPQVPLAQTVQETLHYWRRVLDPAALKNRVEENSP